MTEPAAGAAWELAVVGSCAAIASVPIYLVLRPLFLAWVKDILKNKRKVGPEPYEVVTAVTTTTALPPVSDEAPESISVKQPPMTRSLLVPIAYGTTYGLEKARTSPPPQRIAPIAYKTANTTDQNISDGNSGDRKNETPAPVPPQDEHGEIEKDEMGGSRSSRGTEDEDKEEDTGASDGSDADDAGGGKCEPADRPYKYTKRGVKVVKMRRGGMDVVQREEDSVHIVKFLREGQEMANRMERHELTEQVKPRQQDAKDKGKEEVKPHQQVGNRHQQGGKGNTGDVKPHQQDGRGNKVDVKPQQDGKGNKMDVKPHPQDGKRKRSSNSSGQSK